MYTLAAKRGSLARPSRRPMGFAHITADQKRHAFRQRLAGVSIKQIQRNQRHLFGSLAPTMSVRSIRRAHTAGLKGNAAPPCRRFVPGWRPPWRVAPSATA